MRIRLNGKDVSLPDGMTLRDLVRQYELDGEPVAIERNGQIVDRQAFEAEVIQDGDVIEMVRFVGGG
ncbi:sulfur carrier protein ThiS [Alicyclobacillus acidocaldarius]|uniref:Thiamine biosynthesis protein ThiS n=1 Tax=Alicyclobacillus acidocaldarius subsp. acidocaldarius (strain ATCC 27009 / DSM 446 / BCRC 14685 / JCM 5260 / KCTC 1825 / NBRC 15652 / NCIMB 11725 / NRRL B-14509 / 104-IA) TaxID=521098 RepID=C8WSK3_ALIAD|nr:sulfur carrier protein ThiS [Alicyclobacillus acidocaldarius]ACV59488.1 thiamine biosynthesis protein ThiS [Alicyclobacillus acidocaldarius subsp. acidocaldarius DSM 446]